MGVEASLVLRKILRMQILPTKVLRIDSSYRINNSYSRLLTSRLIDQLCKLFPEMIVTERNISNELPFLSETMIEAMFIPEDKRTPHQKQILSLSDTMIDELKQTDILVLGLPVYNFSIAANLKAYIDLVTRAGMTFQYTEKGAKGLIKNVRAYVVMTSGGTAMHSDMDFVSGYIRFILSFIGITDVHLINATQLRTKGAEEIISKAMADIELIVATD